MSVGSLGSVSSGQDFEDILSSLLIYHKAKEDGHLPTTMTCLLLLMSEQMLKETNGQTWSLHLTKWSQQSPQERAAHAPERHKGFQKQRAACRAATHGSRCSQGDRRAPRLCPRLGSLDHWYNCVATVKAAQLLHTTGL